MKRTMEDVMNDMWNLYYEGGVSEEGHIEADNLLIEALQIASEEGIEKYQADAIKVAYEGIGKWYA